MLNFLKKALGIKDDLKTINPFYAPEPLSPHLAFRRAKIKFDKAGARNV
jgi:dethiobiotin synthetase